MTQLTSKQTPTNQLNKAQNPIFSVIRWIEKFGRVSFLLFEYVYYYRHELSMMACRKELIITYKFTFNISL